MNNNIWIRLLDNSNPAILIDDVELGAGDVEGDGADNNAPSGNAQGIWDEAVSRMPDGMDRDMDKIDFRRQYASPGMNNFDADDDGVPDVVEILYDTNPLDRDTDDDGIDDGIEIRWESDPLDSEIIPADAPVLTITYPEDGSIL
jgi:hypothetical protein